MDQSTRRTVPAPIPSEAGDPSKTRDMERLIRTQNVAIEVIGTFGQPWSKRGKGRTYKGVEFKPQAVRLIHARNGKTLIVSKF